MCTNIQNTIHSYQDALVHLNLHWHEYTFTRVLFVFECHEDQLITLPFECCTTCLLRMPVMSERMVCALYLQ